MKAFQRCPDETQQIVAKGQERRHQHFHPPTEQRQGSGPTCQLNADPTAEHFEPVAILRQIKRHQQRQPAEQQINNNRARHRWNIKDCLSN
jgi:hypothetical protein